MKNIHHDIVNLINQFIFDNISTTINIKQIADLVGVSKFHLHRVFAAQTGFEIAEYIQRRKMETAFSMLQKGPQSIIEVALAVGYESHSAFSRAFKKAYGFTPNLCMQGQYKDSIITYKKSDKNISEQLSTSWVSLAQQKLYGIYCRGFEKQSFAKIADKNFSLMTDCSAQQDYLLSEPVGVSLGNPWANTSETSDFFCGFLSGLNETDNDRIELLTWPEGHYICCEYVGPYHQMWQFISKLHSTWISEKKVQLSTRLVYQRYLNHPAQTAQEQLKTLLYFPVEKIL